MPDAPTYSEWLNSIKVTKTDLWSDFDGDEKAAKEYAKSYSPYLITRSLMDANGENLFLINAINQFPNFDKKMHYQYLLHSIPKGQKYISLSKSQKEKKMEKMWAEVQAEEFELKKGGMGSTSGF